MSRPPFSCEVIVQPGATSDVELCQLDYHFPDGVVDVDLCGLDGHGQPGVCIVNYSGELRSPRHLRITWDSLVAVNGRLYTTDRDMGLDTVAIAASPSDSSRRVCPYADENGTWLMPRRLKRALIDLIEEQDSALWYGERKVLVNAAYQGRVINTDAPPNGSTLHLRELHPHELLTGRHANMVWELCELGLGSSAFIAVNEDADDGELSEAPLDGQFQLGAVTRRTPHASVYSVRDIGKRTDAVNFEARAYVLDGVPPKLRRSRLRNMSRLLGRHVVSTQVHGQQVVVYKVDDPGYARGTETTRVEKGGVGVNERKAKEFRREKARIKQRDRRRRARIRRTGEEIPRGDCGRLSQDEDTPEENATPGEESEAKVSPSCTSEQPDAEERREEDADVMAVGAESSNDQEQEKLVMDRREDMADGTVQSPEKEVTSDVEDDKLLSKRESVGSRKAATPESEAASPGPGRLARIAQVLSGVWQATDTKSRTARHEDQRAALFLVLWVLWWAFLLWLMATRPFYAFGATVAALCIHILTR